MNYLFLKKLIFYKKTPLFTHLFMKFSNLNSDKNLYQYLSKIYGIGKKNSLRICDFLGLCKNTKYKSFSRNTKDRIDFYIQQNFFTESEYKNLVKKDIVRHIEISSYRGIRHSRGLPCRGQRTHGNAKTVRRTRNF